MSFKPHIESLAKNFETQIGLLRNENYLLTRNETFLFILDFGDILYLNASDTLLIPEGNSGVAIAIWKICRTI